MTNTETQTKLTHATYGCLWTPKQRLNAALDAIAARLRRGELTWQDARGERDCAHEDYRLDLESWNQGREQLWPLATGYRADTDD